MLQASSTHSQWKVLDTSAGGDDSELKVIKGNQGAAVLSQSSVVCDTAAWLDAPLRSSRIYRVSESVASIVPSATG